MQQFSIAKFKEQNSFDDRKADVVKKLQRYPEYVPIIIELYAKAPTYEGLFLEKNKYLVAQDLKFMEFQESITRKMKLPSNFNLFWYVAQTKLERPSEFLGDIYKKKQDADGYLYITLSPMEAFGSIN